MPCPCGRAGAGRGGCYSRSARRKKWTSTEAAKPVIKTGRSAYWTTARSSNCAIALKRQQYVGVVHGAAQGQACKPLPPEHELVVWIMLATLARINEIGAARWAHVDFNRETGSSFPHAKNSKGFPIHLSLFAPRLPRELPGLTRHTPFVLPHPDDETPPSSIALLQCVIVSRRSRGKWKNKNRNANVTAICSARSSAAQNMLMVCAMDSRRYPPQCARITRHFLALSPAEEYVPYGIAREPLVAFEHRGSPTGTLAAL